MCDNHHPTICVIDDDLGMKKTSIPIEGKPAPATWFAGLVYANKTIQKKKSNAPPAPSGGL